MSRNKKKICFVSINAYSLFNPDSFASVGGTEVQLFNLANHLAENTSWKVSFIVGDWGQADVEIYNKIEVFRSFSLRPGAINYLKAPLKLWRTLKKVNADIYITSSAGAETGIVAAFCHCYGKRFVYRTACDWDCNGEFEKKRGLIGRLFGFGLRRADQVIVQNKRNQKMLSKQGIPSTIVRNGFVVNTENLIDFENRRYILWLARCAFQKNPEAFLSLAERLPQEKFLMIASPTNREKKLFVEIEKKATKLPNVEFVGGVKFDETEKYFRRAKVFVGTSRFEGFPNTYLQACLAGAPVVSYRVNPDEFITKNNLGYCADGDFDRMLIQIKGLLNDRDDWTRKSKNALDYVEKNHNIDKIGKKWEDLINQILRTGN